MAADFQTIGIRPHVIGVMDGPRRQPQHFFREGREDFQTRGINGRGSHRNWIVP